MIVGRGVLRQVTSSNCPLCSQTFKGLKTESSPKPCARQPEASGIQDDRSRTDSHAATKKKTNNGIDRSLKPQRPVEKQNESIATELQAKEQNQKSTTYLCPPSMGLRDCRRAPSAALDWAVDFKEGLAPGFCVGAFTELPGVLLVAGIELTEEAI